MEYGYWLVTIWLCNILTTIIIMRIENGAPSNNCGIDNGYYYFYDCEWWVMIKMPWASKTAAQRFYTQLKYELIDFHFNKFHNNWIFFYYLMAFIDTASIIIAFIIDMSIVRLAPFPSTHSFILLRRKPFIVFSFPIVKLARLIFLCGRLLSIINATREKWLLMHVKNRIKQMKMEKISKL